MIRFREATQEDLPAICRLGHEVNLIHHQAHPAIFAGPGAPERDAANWAQGIGGASAATIVAVGPADLVGFVTVTVHDETHSFFQPQRFGRVGSLCVTAHRRGEGIGRQLMRLAEAWVQAHGGREVRLHVYAFNDAALALYESLGYDVRSHVLAKGLPA